MLTKKNTLKNKEGAVNDDDPELQRKDLYRS